MENLTPKSLQHIYDTLIKMSNDAYGASTRHEDATLFSVQQSAKSEAYDISAELLSSACSIYNIPIEEKMSDRQRDIEEQRREECAADAELDVTELIYHDEEVH